MFLPFVLAGVAALGAPAPAADPAAPLLALTAGAEAKCKALAAKLDACRAAGQDISDPDASLAVAELFCRFSRYDAGRDDLREPALRSMGYVDKMLDEELRRADEVLAGRAKYPAIPPWRAGAGVTWHDGGFWSGGEPLFLSGFNWDAGEAEREPDLLKRLGLNLADGMFRGTALRPDGSFDDRGFEGREGPYLEKAGRAGFAVDCLYGVGMPQPLIDATPGLAARGYGNGVGYVIEHPEAVRYREKVIDHLAPLCAARPGFFAVDLANEPCFQGPSDLMLANWRAWLQRKYGDVAGLNRAWGTNLASFDDVKRYPSQPAEMRGQWDRGRVDFDKPGVRGAHYDWCAFNNERISAYFASLSERIRAGAPNAATHVKVMMGLYFTGSTESRGWAMGLSYHTFGIDPEALARSCSLLGCDLDLIDLSHVEKPNRRFGSMPYVAGWIDAGLSADFMKSLAPEKPFYNSEFHVIEDDKDAVDAAASESHMATALWLAHLHGMAANILWYWGRGTDGAPMGQGAQWFKGSLLQQPWALRAYARETLSLRRFVRPVMAFARQPRPVRLLYSEASAIQDVKYLDALRDAYEALNFLGVSIGVVTERQLAEGGVPADTRLLVVPHARYVQDETVAALRSAAAKGVRVGILGDESLTAVPTGGRRADAAVPGAQRINLGTPQEYHPRFDAWLREAGVQRELTAVDAAGGLAWGIEVRTARDGNQRLAYLVNLMRDPVTVTLRWSAPNAHLTDWRTDKAVPSQVTLAPRQVVFGGY